MSRAPATAARMEGQLRVSGQVDRRAPAEVLRGKQQENPTARSEQLRAKSSRPTAASCTSAGPEASSSPRQTTTAGDRSPRLAIPSSFFRLSEPPAGVAAD